MTKQEIFNKNKVYGNVKCSVCGETHQEVICILSGYEFLKPKTTDICEKCFLKGE